MRLLLTLLLVHAAFATSPQTMVEKLIADAWQPNHVRVEWTFSGQVSSKLAQTSDWQLSEPLPTHLAGSMNLKLVRITESNTPEQAIVSGRARIFGSSYTVKHTTPSGSPVVPANLDTTELEWTLLSSPPVAAGSLPQKMIAAKTLIPGRPLAQDDIKPMPMVRRGQQIGLAYQKGLIKVVMKGRALLDGAIGETIPVSVDLGKEKRYQGKVQSDGSVQLEL